MAGKRASSAIWTADDKLPFPNAFSRSGSWGLPRSKDMAAFGRSRLPAE